LHPKGAGLSDSQIAEHVGVSQPYVGKLRKEMEESGQLKTVISCRRGKDGKTYNTTNIGGGSPTGRTRGQPITSDRLAKEYNVSPATISLRKKGD